MSDYRTFHGTNFIRPSVYSDVPDAQDGACHETYLVTALYSSSEKRVYPTSRTRPAVHFLTLAGAGPIRPKRNHTKPLTHQTARQGGLSIHSAGSWKRLSSSTIFFSTRWDLPCRHHRAHTLPGAVQLLLHFPPASRHGSGGQDGTVSPSRCRCGTLPMWLHVATMVGCRRIPRPLRISVISSLSLICGAG